MNKIEIMTDNCCDIPRNILNDRKIDMIPIYYRFEEENIEYGDEVKLTSKEFFKKMKMGLIPKTMSCNPLKISEQIEKKLKENKDVIYISISSGLSSNYYNVLLAIELLKKSIQIIIL